MNENECPTFSVDGVCRILEACKSTGVRELKFGALQVVFGLPDPAPPVESPSTPPTEAAISEQAKNIANEAFVQDEVAIKQDQLLEMLITDPLGLERLMEIGEIELEDPASEPKAE